MSLARWKLGEKGKNTVRLLSIVFPCLFFKKKIKETKPPKLVQSRALITPRHDLLKSYVFARQFGEASRCPMPPAAAFPSLLGLIVLLATPSELLQHSNLAENSLPPILFLGYFGPGSIGTGASLGWEAWRRAVVARGCWGSIAWGTAAGPVMLPSTPGFWSNSDES